MLSEINVLQVVISTSYKKVDLKLLIYSAFWSVSAFQFSIYSALLSVFWPSGFLFIRPSGFGLIDQFGIVYRAKFTFLSMC